MIKMRQNEGICIVFNKGFVKNEITKAFLTLLKEKELKDITITEICNIAQVGRASFYRNYNNLEDILVEYTDYLLSTIDFTKRYDGYSKVESILYSVSMHVMDKKSYYGLIHKRKLNSILLNSIKDLLNLNKTEKDKLYLTSFISFGIHGIISSWIKNGMKESPSELVLILRNYNNI